MSKLSKAIGVSNENAQNAGTGGLYSIAKDYLTGENAANAAKEAAQIQLEGTKLGIAEAKAAREQARADLSPFREAGAGALGGLSSLIQDPNAQKNFITNNPFFKALADDAQQRLFSNQAAKGKIGSGETPKALQNSLLLLGNDLLNQSISQRFNLATLGANAAAGQATATQNAGSSIANLITGGANAQAAGVVGAANARTNAMNQAIQTGIGVYSASDIRVKRDIKQISEFNGLVWNEKFGKAIPYSLPVYKFKYIWSEEDQIGFMAHEVRELFPDAVKEINGILHVNYSKVMYAH
jgi:hypothetical protein